MSEALEALDGAVSTLRALLPTLGQSALARASCELHQLQLEYEAAAAGQEVDLADLNTASAAAPAANATANDKQRSVAPGEDEAHEETHAAALKRREANRKKHAAQKAKKKQPPPPSPSLPPPTEVLGTSGSTAASLSATGRVAGKDDTGDTLPDGVRGAVRIFRGRRGRGLQCVTRVRKGEPIIGIPCSWAISTNEVSRTGGSSGQMDLALTLVQLKRRKDFRVAHMPETLDMPAFWSDTELQWLAASFVYDSAKNQRPTLESMYKSASPEYRAECTMDEFVWGMCMVQSRTFGGNNVMIVLPFIDLVGPYSITSLRATAACDFACEMNCRMLPPEAHVH